MGPEPEPVGDYGYDLAHDVPRREQAAAHPDPGRPRSTAAGRRGIESRADYEYDEAHDF